MLAIFLIVLGVCLCALKSSGMALKDVMVTKVSTGLGVPVSELQKDSLVVYGTYAADFNNIEYAQRLNHYKDQMKDEGIKDFHFIMNASPKSAQQLASLLDISDDINIYADEFGKAGKEFGVSLGWRPNDNKMNEYLKLFGMLWGLGAWKTLPSVIGGYLGNPFSEQPWIETALVQGNSKGRFPTNALEMEGTKVVNKFASLPVVGNWGRRPLELATLRLQNMVGVSIQNWDDLRPSDEALKAGVLTQLGGCCVYDSEGGTKFTYKDEGICNVVKFEDILDTLQGKPLY